MIRNYTKFLPFILYLLLLTLSAVVHAQRITNLILVGPNGVTENIKEATSFIEVKEYPDGHFERLDYKRAAPLVMLRSYKDQTLTVLDGRTMEYHPNGQLKVRGSYASNMRNGEWTYYNDTGGVVKVNRYLRDSILPVSPDEEVWPVNYMDEKEASFPGGAKAWEKYLLKSLEKSRTANKSFTSGTVYVNFVIDSTGNVDEVFLRKSVEYIIDEESIQIIRDSPKWIPAFQSGRHVKAYRIQPLTFIKE